MRRIYIVITAVAVVAILVPSAGGALPYPHPHPAASGEAGTQWAAVAAALACVSLLLGAATVLPRRSRRIAVA